MATYERMGLNTIVKTQYPTAAAGLTMTLLDQSGGLDLGDAGDTCTGLDRFGRLQTVSWITASFPTQEWEHVDYGFDRLAPKDRPVQCTAPLQGELAPHRRRRFGRTPRAIEKD